jgi:ribosomal protein L11 methyltransferase
MVRIELNIEISPKEPWTDILIAQLSEIGFDSFMDTETGVLAYINEADFQEENMQSETILGLESEDFIAKISLEKIPHQNWNALWESDFHPVFVEDKLTIIAPFHDPKLVKGMGIIIQPQMSFGTGHHQTTWMMTKAMMEFVPFPKKVLDMGTGTGVLAILAEKLEATEITAIDIEPWSVENTIENLERNRCSNSTSLCGDIDLIDGLEFDLILANINKNVLKKHLASYASHLVNNGTLIISGFFETDVEELIEVARLQSLEYVKKFTKETWAAVQFIKNKV